MRGSAVASLRMAEGRAGRSILGEPLGDAAVTRAGAAAALRVRERAVLALRGRRALLLVVVGRGPRALPGRAAALVVRLAPRALFGLRLGTIAIVVLALPVLRLRTIAIVVPGFLRRVGAAVFAFLASRPGVPALVHAAVTAAGAAPALAGRAVLAGDGFGALVGGLP